MATITQVLEEAVVEEAPADLPPIDENTGHRMRGVIDHLHERMAERQAAREDRAAARQAAREELQELEDRLRNISLEDEQALERARGEDRADPPSEPDDGRWPSRNSRNPDPYSGFYFNPPGDPGREPPYDGGRGSGRRGFGGGPDRKSVV